jgi:hypothetical protein
MNEELKSVLRMALHKYADEHGFVADNFYMSPEVRHRTWVVHWELCGNQLRYEFHDPAAPRT